MFLIIIVVFVVVTVNILRWKTLYYFSANSDFKINWTWMDHATSGMDDLFGKRWHPIVTYSPSTSNTHTLPLGCRCHHGKVMSKKDSLCLLYSIRCSFGDFPDTESFLLFPWSTHGTPRSFSVLEGFVARSSKRTYSRRPCYQCRHGNDLSKMGLGSIRYTNFEFLGTENFLPSPWSKDDNADLGWCCLVSRFSIGNGSLPLGCRCHLEMLGTKLGWNSIHYKWAMAPGTASCVQFLWSKSWSRSDLPSIAKAKRNRWLRSELSCVSWSWLISVALVQMDPLTLRGCVASLCLICNWKSTNSS